MLCIVFVCVCAAVHTFPTSLGSLKKKKDTHEILVLVVVLASMYAVHRFRLCLCCCSYFSYLSRVFEKKKDTHEILVLVVVLASVPLDSDARTTVCVVCGILIPPHLCSLGFWWCTTVSVVWRLWGLPLPAPFVFVPSPIHTRDSPSIQSSSTAAPWRPRV